MKHLLFLPALAIALHPPLPALADTIAHWTFNPSSPEQDTQSLHRLTLRGEDTLFVPDERFAGALLLREEKQPGSIKQGAEAPAHEALNPKGAFTLELSVQPDGHWAEGRPRAVLIDKKYFFVGQPHADANLGYLFSLRRNPKGKTWLEAELGLGTQTERIHSAPLQLTARQWHHLAFSYDGVNTVKFYHNGALITERTLETGGPVAPSKRPITIGDRNSSTYARFTGRIADVKISDGANAPTPSRD